MITPCPFCGAQCDICSNNVTRWMCGTIGLDDCGEYVFGAECDKTMFKNGFVRCLELLKEVAACGISHTAKGSYHEVQIPLPLWTDIQTLGNTDILQKRVSDDIHKEDTAKPRFTKTSGAS